MRRVVVTGLGLLSPLGCGVEESWSRLLEGRSGAGTIRHFDASHLPAQIACEIPLGDGTDATFQASDWVANKDQRKIDRFITYALCAADQAVADAGWRPEETEALERTGVLIGSGIGGIESIAETAVTLKEKGPRRVSPFFIP
ncbi:MAG: beta-ketoacyl synthase N-terminal-like domain-containing protein, partial [Pseudomonadota bacterium]